MTKESINTFGDCASVRTALPYVLRPRKSNAVRLVRPVILVSSHPYEEEE